MNKETHSNAVYLINEMLSLIIASPIKNKKGYFSLIYKWTSVDGYTLDYVYFVVKNKYEKFMKNGTRLMVGYFENSLKKMVDGFDPEINSLPYCGTRDELLQSGHTVGSLPYCLLTKEERKLKNQDLVSNVTDDDRKELKKFLVDI